MSEAHDADAGIDEIDLSDVPMDGADDGGPEGTAEGAEGEEDGDKAAAARRAPLAPEELEKRLTSTKTALAEERRARREDRDRFDRMERELSDLRAGGGQPRKTAAEAEAEIDPDVDPVGALRQLNAKVKAYEAAERLDNQSHEQRQATEAAYTRVEQELADHEADFREEQPDYDAAAKHYAVTRAQELMHFGLQAAQIQPMLREEFVKLAATAIKARKNPASVIYAMAKGRGYGQEAGAADPTKTGKTKLDSVRSGQRATSPMARAGARASNGLDPTTISNIDIRSKKGREAFDKAFDAMERQAKTEARGR